MLEFRRSKPVGPISGMTKHHGNMVTAYSFIASPSRCEWFSRPQAAKTFEWFAGLQMRAVMYEGIEFLQGDIERSKLAYRLLHRHGCLPFPI
jgi:hypothetical protein